MKISIAKYVNGGPDMQSVDDVEVPALPRKGDHLSHEPSGLNGYVSDVMFWWPDDGDELVIEVRVK